MNAIRATRAINQRELDQAVAPSASWHADYRDTAYIYIGGLPLDLSEGDVITIFSQFGNPTHLNLVREKETGKPRGFAFLKYEDQRSCDLAVDNLGGAEVLGRVLRVDHSRYKKKEGEDEDTWRIERMEGGVRDWDGDGGKREGGDKEEEEGEGEGRKRKKRKVVKAEKELEEMLAIKSHGEDEEDPMREYLIREKREEVELARVKERDDEERSRRRRHKREKHEGHHHRRGDRRDEDDDDAGKSRKSIKNEDDREETYRHHHHGSQSRLQRNKHTNEDGDLTARKHKHRHGRHGRDEDLDTRDPHSRDMKREHNRGVAVNNLDDDNDDRVHRRSRSRSRSESQRDEGWRRGKGRGRDREEEGSDEERRVRHRQRRYDDNDDNDGGRGGDGEEEEKEEKSRRREVVSRDRDRDREVRRRGRHGDR